jgi:hypothetical protein
MTGKRMTPANPHPTREGGMGWSNAANRWTAQAVVALRATVTLEFC